eukprot:53631-Rhodomonas_salina.1
MALNQEWYPAALPSVRVLSRVSSHTLPVGPRELGRGPRDANCVTQNCIERPRSPLRLKSKRDQYSDPLLCRTTVVESLLLLTAVTATDTITGLCHPRSGAGYSCSAVYSTTLNMTITLCSGGADRTRSAHLAQ